MNPVDIAILAVVGAIVACIIGGMIYKKVKGKNSGCSCGCSSLSCANCPSASNRDGDKNNRK